MAFLDDLERKASPVRRSILEHPFVIGVGDGSLDVNRFKFYIRQDYLYLIDYSRVLALASAKAPSLEIMAWFARLLDETLNTEMDLHRSYCAEFGIKGEDLDSTVAAPATLNYTSYLINVAYQGSFVELASALLPCQWGYWEIGNYLNTQGLPENAPLYSKWIKMYASSEFKALADWLRDLVSGLVQNSSESHLELIERAYLTSLRHEYLFWEMSYKKEQWPV